MKDWLRRNKLTPFTFVIYSTILIVTSYIIVNKIVDTNVVKRDFKVTTGWIVEIKEFGVGPNRYLTYSYSVNGKLYSREINGPNSDFSECKDNMSLCESKRFMVLYSPNNPEKSLIDLTREIQNIDNPGVPEKLTWFE